MCLTFPYLTLVISFFAFLRLNFSVLHGEKLFLQREEIDSDYNMCRL